MKIPKEILYPLIPIVMTIAGCKTETPKQFTAPAAEEDNIRNKCQEVGKEARRFFQEAMDGKKNSVIISEMDKTEDNAEKECLAERGLN